MDLTLGLFFVLMVLILDEYLVCSKRVVGFSLVEVSTVTTRHHDMIYFPFSGSGKTMTLFSALRSLPDMEVVGLNFSSATTPQLLLKTFDHYCEYK